jgi:hypothetical protein
MPRSLAVLPLVLLTWFQTTISPITRLLFISYATARRPAFTVLGVRYWFRWLAEREFRPPKLMSAANRLQLVLH